MLGPLMSRRKMKIDVWKYTVLSPMGLGTFLEESWPILTLQFPTIWQVP